MDDKRNPAAVFVVRMWHEASTGTPGRWRGSVDHVGNGARMYFSNVGSMCEFILAERERETAPERGVE